MPGAPPIEAPMMATSSRHRRQYTWDSKQMTVLCSSGQQRHGWSSRLQFPLRLRPRQLLLRWQWQERPLWKCACQQNLGRISLHIPVRCVPQSSKPSCKVAALFYCFVFRIVHIAVYVPNTHHLSGVVSQTTKPTLRDAGALCSNLDSIEYICDILA